MKLAIVSPNAKRLGTLLRGRVGEDVLLAYWNGVGEPEAQVLEAEVVLGAPDLAAAVMDQLSALRWLQSTWAGVTPLVGQPRRDYLLTGVKGIFGRSMAEYVLAWVLAEKRSVLRHSSATSWDGRPDKGLAGLRLGIAGVGSIGAEVAQRCGGFFASVRGLNGDGRTVPGVEHCFGAARRLDFARGLDVLVLLLPDTEATNQFADKALLEQLAPGAMVINAGRGNALDLDAALEALSGGRLSSLVLDVLAEEPLPAEDPLWRTTGVHITSHTAAPTNDEAIVALFLNGLTRYRRGEEPAGRIDFDRGY